MPARSPTNITTFRGTCSWDEILQPRSTSLSARRRINQASLAWKPRPHSLILAEYQFECPLFCASLAWLFWDRKPRPAEPWTWHGARRGYSIVMSPPFLAVCSAKDVEKLPIEVATSGTGTTPNPPKGQTIYRKSEAAMEARWAIGCFLCILRRQLSCKPLCLSINSPWPMAGVGSGSAVCSDSILTCVHGCTLPFPYCIHSLPCIVCPPSLGSNQGPVKERIRHT